MSDTPDNVIPFNAAASKSADGRDRPAAHLPPDRNVALAEAVLTYVRSHPATQESADVVAEGMTSGDAQMLRHLIKGALSACANGPDDFDAWACKDLLHFEQWLRHYDKQLRSFLEEQDEVPSDWA